MREDELKAEYRRATSPAGPCPDSGTLVRAAEGSLEGGERESVLSHLETCATCADGVRAAFAALGGAEASARDRPRPASLRTWLAIAAGAAILAVGASIVVLRGPAPLSGGERGAPAAAARCVPADGAVLDGPPAELLWLAAPPAEEYVFVLYDAGSDLLWQSPPAKTPGTTLPAEIRERVRPGGRYLWRVKVRRGFEIRESPVFAFSLKAR